MGVHICKISISSQFLSDSEDVDIKAIAENHPALETSIPETPKGEGGKPSQDPPITPRACARSLRWAKVPHLLAQVTYQSLSNHFDSPPPLLPITLDS